MHFCGLDVSLRQTAVCIVDGDGKIAKEAKVASDPEVIAEFLTESGYPLERIGLEAGSTAAWLQAGLAQQGWPAVCIDARHAAAALKAGFRNKNDKNDARGIAQMMRTNSFRPVWVKSMAAQRLGAMFTARNTIQDQLIRIENVIRGILRCDGVILPLGRARFEAELREQLEGESELLAIVEPLLLARAELLKQRGVFDRRIIAIARKDPVCRLLMTAPAVGPHIALAFKAGIDDPGALRSLPHRRRALRSDPAQVRVGGDRLLRADQQDGRPACPAHALHRRPDHAAAGSGLVVRLEGLGAEGRQDPRPGQGAGRARPQAGRRLHKMWVTGEPFRWRMNEAVA